jgi:hypothetical protein
MSIAVKVNMILSAWPEIRAKAEDTHEIKAYLASSNPNLASYVVPYLSRSEYA